MRIAPESRKIFSKSTFWRCIFEHAGLGVLQSKALQLCTRCWVVCLLSRLSDLLQSQLWAPEMRESCMVTFWWNHWSLDFGISSSPTGRKKHWSVASSFCPKNAHLGHLPRLQRRSLYRLNCPPYISKLVQPVAGRFQNGQATSLALWTANSSDNSARLGAQRGSEHGASIAKQRWVAGKAH